MKLGFNLVTSNHNYFHLKNKAMLEIQENKTNGVTHPKNIDYEWKKYNKRMEKMIDDAEIESEMDRKWNQQ